MRQPGCLGPSPALLVSYLLKVRRYIRSLVYSAQILNFSIYLLFFFKFNTNINNSSSCSSDQIKPKMEPLMLSSPSANQALPLLLYGSLLVSACPCSTHSSPAPRPLFAPPKWHDPALTRQQCPGQLPCSHSLWSFRLSGLVWLFWAPFPLLGDTLLHPRITE